MKILLLLFALVLGMFADVQMSYAGYASFGEPTDTISVSGYSVLGTDATYEARVSFTQPLGNNDIHFYVEYLQSVVHKGLGMSGNMLNGYSAPINGGAMYAPVQVTPGAWYHLAYVYDGGEERLYIDGNLMGSRSASGSISNHPGSYTQVGACPYPGGIGDSFIGMLDTIRISTVARYSGSAFAPPTGDLTADAYTDLLYNFDEGAGSTAVSDLSGHGRNGTFGVGFQGATVPEILPEPSSIVALLCGIAGLGGVLLKRRA